MILCIFLFFFFKQKTAYEMRISDWSSDVCSSDLVVLRAPVEIGLRHAAQELAVVKIHVELAEGKVRRQLAGGIVGGLEGQVDVLGEPGEFELLGAALARGGEGRDSQDQGRDQRRDQAQQPAAGCQIGRATSLN